MSSSLVHAPVIIHTSTDSSNSMKIAIVRSPTSFWSLVLKPSLSWCYETECDKRSDWSVRSGWDNPPFWYLDWEKIKMNSVFQYEITDCDHKPSRKVFAEVSL